MPVPTNQCSLILTELNRCRRLHHLSCL